MYSRTSSLASLSSCEQHSIVDDRSSVISDMSRLTSGAISPSDLPDSASTAPSPHPRSSGPEDARAALRTGQLNALLLSSFSVERVIKRFYARLQLAVTSVRAYLRTVWLPSKMRELQQNTRERQVWALLLSRKNLGHRETLRQV